MALDYCLQYLVSRSTFNIECMPGIYVIFSLIFYPEALEEQRIKFYQGGLLTAHNDFQMACKANARNQGNAAIIIKGSRQLLFGTMGSAYPFDYA